MPNSIGSVPLYGSLLKNNLQHCKDFIIVLKVVILFLDFVISFYDSYFFKELKYF
jgi:hypothetical protein